MNETTTAKMTTRELLELIAYRCREALDESREGQGDLATTTLQARNGLCDVLSLLREAGFEE
jgi:hypothetical protein